MDGEDIILSAIGIAMIFVLIGLAVWYGAA